MSTVLQLQKLTPSSNLNEVHVVLLSTYSGICPTTVLSNENRRFEME